MKPLILVGKSGSGKTTLAQELQKRGFRKIVTYTTRPIRPGEVNGIDYFFVNENYFELMKNDGFFAETAEYNASFGHCYYGSSKESYKLNDQKSLIILNPYGLKSVLSAGVDAFVVYLNASHDVLLERLHGRGDTQEEIERRLESDERDFAGIEPYCNLILDVGNYDPGKIADIVLSASKV